MTIILAPCARLLAAALLPTTLLAQQPDPILARLSGETANVLVVRDVLPVLEHALAAPAVSRFLAATAPLQQEAFGAAYDAASLRRQLGLIAPLVPQEIVLAAPERTLDHLTHAASLFVCATVLQMLGRAGEPDGDLAAAVRATAEFALGEIGELPLQGWIVLRHERTAEQWFDTAARAVEQAARGTGFAVTVGDGRLELRGRPFGEASPVRAELAALGIDVARAPAWELHAVLEQQGPRLSLQVGKLAAPPCRLALPVGEAGGALPLLAVRTGTTDARADFVDVWEHLAALGAVELADGDGMLMLRLVNILGQVDGLTRQSAAVLHVDHGLLWTQEEHSDAEAEHELVPAPAALLRCGQAADGPFLISGETLDVMLLALHGLVDETWSEFGDGLASEELAAVVEYLEDEESALFAPGVLVVVRSTAADHELPVPAVALVGPVLAPGDGASFVAALSERLASGFGIDGDLWQPTDLGLGVPTQALRPGSIAPELAKLAGKNFAPHWCESDGWLVVATDPALSKDLLARLRADGAASPNRPVLRHFACRGEAIAATCRAAAKWVPRISGPGDDALSWSLFLEAFADLVAGTAAIELTSEAVGDVLRTRLAVRLRPVPPTAK